MSFGEPVDGCLLDRCYSSLVISTSVGDYNNACVNQLIIVIINDLDNSYMSRPVSYCYPIEKQISLFRKIDSQCINTCFLSVSMVLSPTSIDVCIF